MPRDLIIYRLSSVTNAIGYLAEKQNLSVN